MSKRRHFSSIEDNVAAAKPSVGASMPEPHPSRHAHPIAASDVGLGFSSGASHARGEKGVEQLSGSASAPVLPEPEPPHPEALAIRNALHLLPDAETLSERTKVDLAEDGLAALDVLVGRLEQAETTVVALTNELRLTTESLGRSTERILALSEALGVPPQPEETGGGKSRRSGEEA
jgi:hypothetical protein